MITTIMIIIRPLRIAKSIMSIRIANVGYVVTKTKQSIS